MEQRIFEQGLSVEATSAYIVLDSLRSAPDGPSVDLARNIWTGTPETLDRALRELAQRRIIELPRDTGGRVELRPPETWA
jgi:sugar lactone lactonase YvrE